MLDDDGNNLLHALVSHLFTKKECSGRNFAFSSPLLHYSRRSHRNQHEGQTPLDMLDAKNTETERNKINNLKNVITLAFRSILGGE
jgi:hypothetical protein